MDASERERYQAAIKASEEYIRNLENYRKLSKDVIAELEQKLKELDPDYDRES